MDFYSTLSRYYDELFPPNSRQIGFLTAHIPLEGRVLDIGAGTGGYAAALAERGAAVDALEIGSMLPYLKKNAERNGFTVMEMAMEQVGGLNSGAYGLIYCIGNTLVHLNKREDITVFLKNCRKLLLPQGQLIIQIVNYDRIIGKNQRSLPLLAVPEHQLTLEREYVLEQDSVKFITKLTHAGEEQVSETRLLAIKQTELAQCLEMAGFDDVLFFGDFEGTPWNPDSSATVVVAK